MVESRAGTRYGGLCGGVSRWVDPDGGFAIRLTGSCWWMVLRLKWWKSSGDDLLVREGLIWRLLEPGVGVGMELPAELCCGSMVFPARLRETVL